MVPDRFGAIATSATVGIMFAVVVFIVPFVTPFSSGKKVLAGVAAALVSVGSYRAIARLLHDLFKRSLIVRRYVLGRLFLEGTWVGHYGHKGTERFTVEFFDQEEGELKIKGREYDAIGNTRASWQSSAATVDAQQDKLIYAYSCDVYERKDQQQGIGVFSIVRKKKRSAASELDGYAADLIDGNKDPNREYKVSDKLLPDPQALEEARRVFSGGHR